MFVRFGAVFNFMSQSVAHRWRLILTAKLLLSMSNIDKNPLQTPVVYRAILHLRDYSSKKEHVVANLIGINILGYDLVQGMAWLSRNNYNIM
jgi:hypothetical protein